MENRTIEHQPRSRSYQRMLVTSSPPSPPSSKSVSVSCSFPSSPINSFSNIFVSKNKTDSPEETNSDRPSDPVHSIIDRDSAAKVAEVVASTNTLRESNSSPSPNQGINNSSSSRGFVSRRGGRGGSSPGSRTGSGAFHSVSGSRSVNIIMPQSSVCSESTPSRSVKGNISVSSPSPIMSKKAFHEGSSTTPSRSADAVPSLCTSESGLSGQTIHTSSSSSSIGPNTPDNTKLKSSDVGRTNLILETPDPSVRQKRTVLSVSSHSGKQQNASPLDTNPQFDASAMIQQSQTKKKPHSITVVASQDETSPLHLQEMHTTTPTKSKPQHEIKSKSSFAERERLDKPIHPSIKSDISSSTIDINRSSTPKPMTEYEISHQTPCSSTLNVNDSKMHSPSPRLFLSPYSPCTLGIIGESLSFGGCNKPNAITKRSTSERSVPKEESEKRPKTILDSTPSKAKVPSTPLKSPLDVNPFSWLTSPTQGIFSPNLSESGKPSLMSPTLSSMFFQENGQNAIGAKGLTPRPHSSGETCTKEKDAHSKKDIHRYHPYSKMICISPLASSKMNKTSKSTGDLPSQNNADHKKEFPDLLNGPLTSPTLHFDDMHMAEKDLMEDEDLSVLLQLASSSQKQGRGGNESRNSHPRHPHPHTSKSDAPSSLHLPLMSGPGDMTESDFLPRPTRMAFRASPERHNGGKGPPPHIPIRSRDHRIHGHDNNSNTPYPPGSAVSVLPKKIPMKRSNSLPPKKAISDKADMSKPARSKSTSLPASNNNSEPYSSPFKQMPPTGGAPGYYHPGMNHGAPYPPPHPHDGVGPHHPPPPRGMPPHSAQYNSHPPYHGHPPSTGAPVGHMIPPHGGPHGGPHHPYGGHPPPHPPHYHPHMMAPYTSINQSAAHASGGKSKQKADKRNTKDTTARGGKRENNTGNTSAKKRARASSSKRKNNVPGAAQKGMASDSKNQSSSLSVAILRGVTMRPSGKWQAQLYYAGKSRYIGVFDTREKAALAYEIAREKLKSNKTSPDSQSPQETELAVSAARREAFKYVNEPEPAHKR